MPKKQQRNAFYFFMQELMQQLKREGKVFKNGMADVVEIAHPRFKNLEPHEKERYEQQARDWKRQMRGMVGDKLRLDNVGNVLADRKDPEEEARKRYNWEKAEIMKNLPSGTAASLEKFYFVDFMTLCQVEEGGWLPCEIGVVEFSLNAGITKTFQRFIETGGIPLGYRYQCKSNSEETHMIPIENFELADANYMGMWIQLENFINPNQEKKSYPPLFCMQSELGKLEYCLGWMHAHAGIHMPNRLHKVFALEAATVALFQQGGAPAISKTQATDLLTTTVFDYEHNTRCEWHEERECKHCALGTVKRYSYALSDALSAVYGFELTKQHLPTRQEGSTCTVIEPGALGNLQPFSQRNRANFEAPSQPTGSRGRGVTVAASDDRIQFRDYRYQAEPNVYDNDEDDDEEEELPQTMRRPNMPAMTALGASISAAQQIEDVAPPTRHVQNQSNTPLSAWLGNSSGKQPPRPTDEEEFPSLGATPPRNADMNKFANRQAAPPASKAPQPPSSWQPAKEDSIAGIAQNWGRGRGENPRAMNQGSPNRPGTQPSAKPTLREAVAASEAETQRPRIGRGGPPRSSSAWGPTASASTSQGAAAPKPANAWGPTPVQNQNHAGVSKPSSAWGSPSEPPKARPPAFGSAATPQMTTDQVNMILASAGRGAGRGRGVWKQQSCPPPGFSSENSMPGLKNGINNMNIGTR